MIDLLTELAKTSSIQFALWLNKNRWYNFDERSQKWCYTFEGGTSLGRGTYEKNYMKTSEELFELFLADERKRLGVTEKK